MEKNDLCLEMSRLQLSNGTISADLVLSFVSEPQWPPTMGRNQHVLFSIALSKTDCSIMPKIDLSGDQKIEVVDVTSFFHTRSVTHCTNNTELIN